MSQALAQAGDDLDLRVGMRGTADVVSANAGTRLFLTPLPESDTKHSLNSGCEVLVPLVGGLSTSIFGQKIF